MVRDARKHLVLTIHKVTDVIDGGEFVARSHRVTIPEGINAIAMHRITWPQMGPFIQRAVDVMLDAAGLQAPKLAAGLREVAVPYRVGTSWPQAVALAA